MAATKGDLSSDTNGPESCGTQEQHEPAKRKAISWSKASVNLLSILAVLIMLSPFTMDITWYGQPLYICTQGVAQFNMTLGGWQTNGLNINLQAVAVKERASEIFIRYPHKDQPKSKQQPAHAATWNQLVWWSYRDAVKSDGVRRRTPAPRLSWLMDLLISRTCCWLLEQQGWVGWPLYLL